MSEEKKPCIDKTVSFTWNCPKCDAYNEAEYDGDSFGTLVCDECKAEYEDYDLGFH